MPKTCFKTFVYSFCTSLFVIFIINGVFWHATPSTPEDIRLPGKNIMLFLNGTQAIPSAKPAPIKKIQLTRLDDIAPEPPVVYQPEESSVLTETTVVSEVILADNSLEIPLEIDLPSLTENTIVVTRAEDIPKSSLPTAKQDKIHPSRQPDIQHKEKISIPMSAPEILLTALAAKENIATSPKEEPPLVLSAKHEPAPLLPLQKDTNTPNRHNYAVKNSQSAPENRVALTGKNIPVSAMMITGSTNDENTPPSQKEWLQMSEKKAPKDSPWVVAQSAGAHKNSLLKEEHFSKDRAAVDAALNNRPTTNKDYELLLASETVKNLLIPIPEDILNDENLTPQLISPASPEGREKEAAIDEQIKKKKDGKTKKMLSSEEKAPPAPQKENITPPNNIPAQTVNDKKKSILSSLSSIFQAGNNMKQPSAQAAQIEEDGLIDTVKKKLRRSKGKIMPTEMRLSFQPNRAEISGQTLRWIQAFATRAASDKNLGIEIRIDGTSARDLQQKRLNLLQNILINGGVPFSKINTVFTSREPNSFIIKTISLRNNETGDTNTANNRTDGMYLQW